MKTSLVCASLVAASASVAPPNKRTLFDNFIKEYQPNYATEGERSARFQIFSENVDRIYSSNAQNKTYTLGVTPHTDLTLEEWRAQYMTGLKPQTLKKGRAIFEAPAGFVELDGVDWVKDGGVTSVKNQGQCGSCWAFSTVGGLEGALHKSGRPLVDLSMQHILACDNKWSYGCGGGLMDQAFEWVKENGVSALKDEPYLCMNANSGQCKGMTCGRVPLVLKPGDVTGFTDVGQTESALEAAVAQQPVSVAIEADTMVFQLYRGGVLTSDACGQQLDHGVLAVGYGVDNGQKYWKVKNSWGTGFGEGGYIRLARGSAESGGECGIRKSASFPTIKPASSIVV